MYQILSYGSIISNTSDTLIDELTARDHLNLYGRLSLIPGRVLKPFAQSVIESIGINDIADRPVKTYSGGNRRKLALALAYVGDPQVIFLGKKLECEYLQIVVYPERKGMFLNW